jgi:hypothetical protein
MLRREGFPELDHFFEHGSLVGVVQRAGDLLAHGHAEVLPEALDGFGTRGCAQG